MAGQRTHIYKPNHVHQNPFERTAIHIEQHHQLPQVNKNIPTETYRPFHGSQFRVDNKGLNDNILDNKSIAKKPPPHKVAPSHASSQTLSRCKNCNQGFTENNPLLRHSKGNMLHCVGCQK